MKARTVAVVAGAALVAYRIRQRGWRLIEHDLVDHPLMTLWPAVGYRLHDRHPWPDDRDLEPHVITGPAEVLERLTPANVAALVAIGAHRVPPGFDLEATPLQQSDQFHAGALLVPDEMGLRACIGCGCTDLAACDPPCSWAQLDPPVCSSCEARSTILPRHRAVLMQPEVAPSLDLVVGYIDQAYAEAREKVVAQGGDPAEWTFSIDDSAPLDRVVVIATPPNPHGGHDA